MLSLFKSLNAELIYVSHCPLRILSPLAFVLAFHRRVSYAVLPWGSPCRYKGIYELSDLILLHKHAFVGYKSKHDVTITYYSGKYPRLSRGRPGFGSPSASHL